MPQDDPSITQWFTSLKFYDEPKAKLLMAVFLQAIEDASMAIKSAPRLPDPPPKPKGHGWAAWECYQYAYKARVKNIKSRRRAVEQAQAYKKAARDWLMRDDTSFAPTAALLHIDADVIREALRSEFTWARWY